jgi:predicted Zn-dependent protease
LSSASEPVGTVEVALGHAERLLDRSPALARDQAEEVLKSVPGHPHARLIVAKAQRIAGDTAAALAVLEPLAREQARASAVHLELGIARAEAGQLREATEALGRAVKLKPDSADGWRLLADVYDIAGDAAAADQARARFIKAATHDPRLVEAAAALVANDLPVAEARLRAHLSHHPTDIAALRMLAEVAGRLRRYRDAEQLLAHCLELAPSFDAARHNYAIVLQRQAKSAEALPEVERLLAREPRNPGYRNLQAAVLANLGNYAESSRVYEAVLAQYPNQPKVWMSYGHSLKTAGRFAESITAYRRALAMEPTLGEAYWSLANLKTYRFSAEDRAAMAAALARTDLAADDRLHFEFALGKALEDAADYESSFRHYAAGNAIRHRQLRYRPEDNTDYLRRCERLFTREFFAARAAAGCPAADPIFILGLPRSGSTLLEQILASHSQVEGTMELPDVPMIVRELDGRHDRDEAPQYPQMLADLPLAQFAALGERYLEATRVQRKAGTPFFIDKMPNNCLHVGLIHLMLPNARIVDARRHPLGCCFSGFKQHFARGQAFSYDLADIGAYYRDYVELMAHFDQVLPGRVHRVIYERLIEDTEAEVRRLLDYCGLPFEDACLRFYENERAVRTASSEQVRQPIFKDGVDHWRHYEPWLGPLKEALGPVLGHYPAVPDFGSAH